PLAPCAFARRMETPMIRNLMAPVFVAIFGLALTAPAANASHCGACNYPRLMRSTQQFCMPTVRYKVCYQTVCEERVCVKYRPVYKTEMKECRYTTRERVYEEC